MAYMNANQRQQAAQEWEKLQNMQLAERHGGRPDFWGAGNAMFAAESKKRQDWARTPRGQYFLSKGPMAFEIAFRKKFYGGYRTPEGRDVNSSSERAIWRAMTGQKNPYTSGVGKRGQVAGSGASNVTVASNNSQSSEAKEDPFAKYVDAWQDQWDAANQANEDRYADIKSGYEDRYARNMDMLRSMGDYQHMRAKEAAGQQARARFAEAAGRGLGDQGGNIKGAVARDLRMEELAINSKLAQMLSSNDAQLSKDKLAFMERRDDEAPDYNQMLALVQKYALGNKGKGFNGGNTSLAGSSGAKTNGQAGGMSLAPLYDLMKEPTYGVPVLAGGYLGGASNVASTPTRGLPYQGRTSYSRKKYYDPYGKRDWRREAIEAKKARRMRLRARGRTRFFGPDEPDEPEEQNQVFRI